MQALRPKDLVCPNLGCANEAEERAKNYFTGLPGAAYRLLLLLLLLLAACLCVGAGQRKHVAWRQGLAGSVQALDGSTCRRARCAAVGEPGVLGDACGDDGCKLGRRGRGGLPPPCPWEERACSGCLWCGVVCHRDAETCD